MKISTETLKFIFQNSNDIVTRCKLYCQGAWLFDDIPVLNDLEKEFREVVGARKEISDDVMKFILTNLADETNFINFESVKGLSYETVMLMVKTINKKSGCGSIELISLLNRLLRKNASLRKKVYETSSFFSFIKLYGASCLCGAIPLNIQEAIVQDLGWTLFDGNKFYLREDLQYQLLKRFKQDIDNDLEDCQTLMIDIEEHFGHIKNSIIPKRAISRLHTQAERSNVWYNLEVEALFNEGVLPKEVVEIIYTGDLGNFVLGTI